MGVINDFRGSFSFIEYKNYGKLEIWDACRVSGTEPNHSGDIGVFLNFKMVGRYKTKQEAYKAVKKLIDEAPTSFFEENKELLLDDLM